MNTKNKIGKLFIISAPSGAGKTSISKEVINRIGKTFNLSKVVTFTSRPPRDREINGKDYNFLSPEKFQEYAKKGHFLESTQYNHKMYASPASIKDNLENNKSLILVVDKDGAKAASKKIPEATTIWITIPRINDLKHRMEKRGESQSEIEKRLTLANVEITEESKHHFFKYHVMNEHFDNAVQDVIKIITDEMNK